MEAIQHGPFITNDAIVLGLLVALIGLVFYSSSLDKGFWKKFYSIVPPLFVCYLLPALCYYPLNLISGETSNLYFVATRYLLPVAIVYLCASADIKGLIGLGPKSLIMFFAGAGSIIIGGVLAFLMAIHWFPTWFDIDPPTLAKGLSTICGSWIGGNANQTAMKEIYMVPENLFASMLVIDVIGAYTGMALLLYGANKSVLIDKWLRADTSSIQVLIQKMDGFKSAVHKENTTSNLIYLVVIGFATCGLAHLLTQWTMPIMKANEVWLGAHKLHAFGSDFFWVICYATLLGLMLSFTRFRDVESYGATQWATVFIYILVATIGMKINVSEIFGQPGLFVIGFVWLVIHLTLLLMVAYMIKAPYFYVAVASQANIGGVASAPIVAAAFHPSLAPVGVIMAVIGNAVGTYGAILCVQIMTSFC
jgi:uncharacterized membrane protein